MNAQNTINAALYDKLNFDFARDIAPVGGHRPRAAGDGGQSVVPAKTIPEFIAYAKANPGKLNMASAGIGGPQHVAGELFKSMAGVDMAHVPYRGSTPAVTDLIAGQVQVMFDVTPTALPQIKVGQAPGARRDHGEAARRAARRADDRRIREGLRGERLDRRRRAEGHAAGDHRNAQQADQRGACSDATIQKRLADLGATPMPPMPPAEFGKMHGRRLSRNGPR